MTPEKGTEPAEVAAWTEPEGATPGGEMPEAEVGESQAQRDLMQSNRMRAWAETVLAIAAVLTVCYFAKLPLIVVLVSILVSFILAPVVDFFQRFRFPRALGALMALCLLFLALYGITYLSYNRAVNFTQDLPNYSGRIQQVITHFKQKAQRLQKSTEKVLPPRATEDKNTVRIKTETNWSDVLTRGLGSVTEIIFVLSFIPFLVFFMLSWQEHVRTATVMLFKMENRNTAYVTLGLISAMIRSFIVGNLLVGAFMGTASMVVFGILGIPYFYFIGYISGFLSIVPYLGVVLAMIPPVVAGMGRLHGAGFIAIGITVLALHVFSLNVLYPKFLGSRLQLNPLAVTIALLFWGWLWGGMGLILAIPITAGFKIIFDHVESLRGLGAWLGE